MTAAPVKTGLTAEEFLALPDSDNYELIDGELVERKQMGLYSRTIAGRVLLEPSAGSITRTTTRTRTGGCANRDDGMFRVE